MGGDRFRSCSPYTHSEPHSVVYSTLVERMKATNQESSNIFRKLGRHAVRSAILVFTPDLLSVIFVLLVLIASENLLIENISVNGKLMFRSCMSSTTQKQPFVIPGNCKWEWTGPITCALKDSNLSSPSWIDISVIENGLWNRLNRRWLGLKAPCCFTSSAFPPELERAARVAADAWTRIIRGRPDDEERVLAISLQMVDTHSNFIAGALSHYDGRSQASGLPLTATILVNSRVAGSYDQCNWNTIMLHEIAHILGFNEIIFNDRKLLHQTSVFGLMRKTVLVGENAKREWNAMGGSRYPLLRNRDGSHWPEIFFISRELMLHSYCPTYTGTVDPYDFLLEEMLGRIEQESRDINLISRHMSTPTYLSRLTLGVFQDLGYDVDMTCAHDSVIIHPFDLHRNGGSAPKIRECGSICRTLRDYIRRSSPGLLAY